MFVAAQVTRVPKAAQFQPTADGGHPREFDIVYPVVWEFGDTGTVTPHLMAASSRQEAQAVVNDLNAVIDKHIRAGVGQ